MWSRRERVNPQVLARRRQDAATAIAALTAGDARLGRVIASIGDFRPIIMPNPFVALIGSILQQQVSMSSAAATFKRLKALCPRQRLTPAALQALTPETLRAAGLSRQKAQYVHNVAAAFAAGHLSGAKLRKMTDDEVIAATTALKGIGRWTAEMLLMFCLERPDVWPVDDLGLKKGVRAFLGTTELPAVAAMNALAEKWRPYRTYATWYLWRLQEGPAMPGLAV